MQLQRKAISFRTIDVGLHVSRNYRPHHQTATETYNNSKVTILQGKGANVVLGDGVYSGCIFSVWKDIKHQFYGVGEYIPLGFELKFRAISADLLGNDYVGRSSIEFLNNLKEPTNLIYKVRQNIIENVPRHIEDGSNGIST